MYFLDSLTCESGCRGWWRAPPRHSPLKLNQKPLLNCFIQIETLNLQDSLVKTLHSNCECGPPIVVTDTLIPNRADKMTCNWYLNCFIVFQTPHINSQCPFFFKKGEKQGARNLCKGNAFNIQIKMQQRERGKCLNINVNYWHTAHGIYNNNGEWVFVWIFKQWILDYRMFYVKVGDSFSQQPLICWWFCHLLACVIYASADCISLIWGFVITSCKHQWN